jgi:hypothetical protein
MTLTLDLHVHTDYSHDGRDPVEKIIESAIRKKIDGIAICDHDTTDGFYAEREYATNNNSNLIVIPGIEVSTSNGHLIVLGTKEVIEKGISLEETIRITRQEMETIVIVAPHPFHPFRHSIRNLCVHADIDAIEIFNSRYFIGIANEMARRVASRNNITAVVGSDAHSADGVGLATVEVEVEAKAESESKPDVKAILRRIKKGAVRIKSCKKMPFLLFSSQIIFGKHRI